jgi:hypothetical protein
MKTLDLTNHEGHWLYVECEHVKVSWIEYDPPSPEAISRPGGLSFVEEIYARKPTKLYRVLVNFRTISGRSETPWTQALDLFSLEEALEVVKAIRTAVRDGKPYCAPEHDPVKRLKRKKAEMQRQRPAVE